MKILVLNCGSSSLKYQLLDMENKTLLAKGNYERIGEKESFLTHKVGSEKTVITKPVYNHGEALNIIYNQNVKKARKGYNEGHFFNTVSIYKRYRTERVCVAFILYKKDISRRRASW
jgi:hypothetical protein